MLATYLWIPNPARIDVVVLAVISAVWKLRQKDSLDNRVSGWHELYSQTLSQKTRANKQKVNRNSNDKLGTFPGWQEMVPGDSVRMAYFF